MHACAQESLALEEGQEEAFVIRASGNKLLEARIDQLRRVVTVSKIAHQTFTSAQWEVLRGQLAAWKVRDNAVVTGLILAVRQCGVSSFTGVAGCSC